MGLATDVLRLTAADQMAFHLLILKIVNINKVEKAFDCQGQIGLCFGTKE